jgi:AraC family transcriptional regulator, positive regulator of tynA and feaB
MRVWSTSQVPHRDSLSYWRDAVCDAFLKVKTEYDSGAEFSGRIASDVLGDVLVNEVNSKRHLVRRSRQCVARDTEAWFFVNLHRSGACALSQAGRDHAPSVGEFSLHDSARPFDLNFPVDMALTCFVVPQSALLSRCPNAADAVAEPLPGTAAGALFRNYARSLADEAQRLSPAQGAAAANAFLDLLALALGARDPAREGARPSLRLALFQRACQGIRAELSNPDFDLESAARRIGLAPRTLQTLFRENGASFSDFLIANRLQWADRLLTMRPDLSVTAIAYAVGFSDLSHFSRSYRRKFGRSAKDRKRGAPLD